MKKKLSGRIFAVLMMLCLLCSSSLMVAYAEGDDKPSGNGMVQIELPDFADHIASFAIYEVGNYNYDGTVTLKDDFSSFSGDLTDFSEASKTLAAAESLAEIAASKKSLDSGTTSESKVVFSSLRTDNSLFLVLQTAGEEIIEVSPMLVILPYRTETGSSISVVIEAKYTDKRIPVEPKGAVVLIKKDKDDKRLPGAHFRFEFKSYIPENYIENTGIDVLSDSKGDYYWDVISLDLVTDEKGQIAIEDLPFGTYRFIETKAPDGYRLSEEPKEFEINKVGKIEFKGDIGEYVAKEGDPSFIIFENELKGGTPVHSSNPVQHSDASKPQSSVPSTVSTVSTVSTPSEVSGSPVITGEDVAKYTIISVVSGVSLAAVVLLLVFGKKRKQI